MKRIVAVIGGSTCTPDEAALAEEVGRLLAAGGVIVVCGGLGGVMEAVARGVRSGGGTTVGVLPGDDPRAANAYIDVPLATGIGEMRNALIVRSAVAVIAVGGGWGTLSEIALARRIGTPVVGLADRFGGAIDIPRAKDAADAVRQALG
jgi:hypothetical protein